MFGEIKQKKFFNKEDPGREEKSFPYTLALLWNNGCSVILLEFFDFSGVLVALKLMCLGPRPKLQNSMCQVQPFVPIC
jgi:hypothetical protein